MKKAVAIAVLMAALVNGFILGSQTFAKADGYFILCNPGSYLNARIKPNKHGSLIGYLYCGDYVETDGQEKGGFAHCVNLTYETDEGWVHTGYFVEDEPKIETFKATVVASGRVSCRNRIGGERIRWAKPGAEVTVFAYTDEWCVTNKGYIQTKYLQTNTKTEKSNSRE